MPRVLEPLADLLLLLRISNKTITFEEVLKLLKDDGWIHSRTDMNKRIVILGKTNIGGYSAYLPELPGCISTADSLLEIKRSIKNSVEFHIEGMQKENLQIPESFQGEYALAYKMDVASLFDWFSGVLTKSGISRLTGMNQSLISQYASGIKSPSTKQTKKIEAALHSLGKELLEIEL